MSASIVAIAGTLLGSTVTFLFQQRIMLRQEHLARAERRRAERLATYTEVATALTDLRRAAFDWWHREHEDPTGTEVIAARDLYFRRLGDARSVQLKLRLLADDHELVDLASRAVERATEIGDASTKSQCSERGEQAKQALDAFVSTASRRLR